MNKKSLSITKIILTTLSCLCLALCLVSMIFTRCAINGASMLPTYNSSGDYALVNNLTFNYNNNDIVVFWNDSYNKRLIKRIVVCPNQTFKFLCNGDDVDLYIKNPATNEFELQSKSFTLDAKMSKNCFNNAYFNFGTEYTVPDDSYVVLGDNRDNSNDSRVIGYIPKSDFDGKVVLSGWIAKYIKTIKITLSLIALILFIPVIMLPSKKNQSTPDNTNNNPDINKESL